MTIDERCSGMTFVVPENADEKFRNELQKMYPDSCIILSGDQDALGKISGTAVNFSVPDISLTAFIPEMSDSNCALRMLAGKENFLRRFISFFVRLFLLIFCKIKVENIYSPLQIWDCGSWDPVNSGKRTFPELLIAAKKSAPEMKIAVFNSDKPLMPPIGNFFSFIFREFLACYHLACFRFSWLHQLVIYGLIGLLAAAVDYGIFALLTFFKLLSPEFASLAGNIVGFLFTFSGNTFYNFKKSDHVIFRFVSYLVIAAGGMAISTLIIKFLQAHINVYLIKAVLTLIVIPLIQFVLNKKITYRHFRD